MLGSANPTAGAGVSTGTSLGNNTAATTVTASGQGLATTSAGSTGLPGVQSGILDTTTSIHSPLTVATFSPPALDLQGGNAVLPPVQAVDQVQQDTASGSASVPLGGPAIPLALPEPGPLVLLVFASVAYLGSDIGRRRRRTPAS
jgi:hypothetical protein